MPLSRRLALLLAATALVAVPAAIARTMCWGAACDEGEPATADIPFCSLPPATRDLLAAGFREGRSADVLTVARGELSGGDVYGDTGWTPRWPSIHDHEETRVPIAFWGRRVAKNDTVASGTTLDQIAPTLASIAGITRPHPEVRSGKAVEGFAGGSPPRLLVLFVLRDVGSASTPPEVSALVEEGWPGTMEGSTGSLPVDPVATMTTIGTGGLPYQHGIVGRAVRDDEGRVTPAWGRRAPVSVIAALGDDLDEVNREKARVGLVGVHDTDRALIGGNWYIDVDRDDVVIGSRHRIAAARKILRSGYGEDLIPDLFAFVIPRTEKDPATAIRRVGSIAERTSRRAVTYALVGTGEPSTGSSEVTSTLTDKIEDEVGADVIEAVVAGGVYLDQEALAREGIARDEVVKAVARARGPEGEPLFEDAFSSLAVTFARFC